MGLKALYEHRIIHYGLKPENLLWNSKNENKILKISNLGQYANVSNENALEN